MDVAELFNQLESNQPDLVEDIKKVFHEHLNTTKESWLVNGLFDYYLSTSSMRSVDILVGVREPHDKHLFDRFSETLKGPTKLQTLTLLGHVVRRQPTWLFKITQHTLLKDLLKLLKAETDILPLMSALLVIIVLLPIIPGLMGPYLQEVFEVFSRLASWNTNNPNKVPEEHLLHLQLGLYFLFHRLYGMYPCNFLSFLRHEYGHREHLGIFSHTIKPMLDTVKMHPLLVTASKDYEIGNSRWVKMEHHDVIVECARFALDTIERTREDVNYQCLTSTFRSRGSSEYSGSLDLYYQQQAKCTGAFGSLAISSSFVSFEKDVWSPSVYCGLKTPPLQESAPTSIPQTPNSQSYIVSLPHQEGASPPEAAIEATPETTPIKDTRGITRGINPSSNVARALNSFGSVKWPGAGGTSTSSTPTQSQPSSPMKKELSPFRFGTAEPLAFEQPRAESSPYDQRRDSLFSQKFNRVHQERIQVAITPTGDKPSLRPKTPGGQPSSPLRVISGEEVPPLELTKDWVVAKPKPEKNGVRMEGMEQVSAGVESSQEDQEVLEIVTHAEQYRVETQPKPVASVGVGRQCDSVLQEFHPPQGDDYEECQGETGSPCMLGGLHMPNSQSMLDFARKVQQHHRRRFYSQCVPETASDASSLFSTGSSPGEGGAFPPESQVRRVNSCPEMKKGPAPSSVVAPSLREEVEEERTLTPAMVSSSTQTVDSWTPLPYEHLFLGILPPAQEHVAGDLPPAEHSPRYSPYVMLDRFIATAVQAQCKEDTRKTKLQGLEGDIKMLKEQLSLLNMQLQFERHRREVHAERNRRLLGKSRSNRALEEHNSALRDQLSLLQKDIENLNYELDKNRKETKQKEQKQQETVNYWQNQCTVVQKEIKDLKARSQMQEDELNQARNRIDDITKELQEVESTLFNVSNEWRQAVAQVSAGEQLRGQLDRLQKEFVLMGELQLRYRERFSQLSLLGNADREMTHLQEAQSEELRAIQEMLDSKNSSLEAARARSSELEAVVTRKDMLIAEKKRALKLVKEEYHDQLEAVESKYKTQRAINQRMEEHILELNHRLEMYHSKQLKGTTRSPDNSSAHEVSVASTGSGGDRQQQAGYCSSSSPLSQSLGSLDGLPPILGGEGVGIKNLQMILDQPVVLSPELASPQPSSSQTPGEEG